MRGSGQIVGATKGWGVGTGVGLDWARDCLRRMGPGSRAEATRARREHGPSCLQVRPVADADASPRSRAGTTPYRQGARAAMRASMGRCGSPTRRRCKDDDTRRVV